MTPTTLVLLPGLDGTGILLGPLLRHLPPWITPLVIEYPVHGENSYETIFEKVDREVASLGSFAILGWSFGGPLALMIAARRPSQVSAVVLCATFVVPPHPRLVRYRFIVRTPVIAFIRTLRRLRYWIPGFACNELRQAKAAIWRRVGARTLAARTRAIMRVDTRPQLKDCRAPLLYLASTQDEVVGRSSLDAVIATAPHTKVAEITGPHLALFTDPGNAAARIAEFLSAN